MSDRALRRCVLLAALIAIAACMSLAQDTPAPQPGAVTQFMVNVKTSTRSSISDSALTEQSERSLNEGGGIFVPLTIHPDGSFEGSGSGSDSGDAVAYGGGISANSHFGGTLNIDATGTVQLPDCSAIPCQPGMMHLVLSGGMSGNQVTAEAHAGRMNKKEINNLPGGKGILIFDLPAAVGSTVEQTLFDNGIVLSKVRVTITGESRNPEDPAQPPVPLPPGFPLGPPGPGGESGGSNNGGSGAGSNSSGGSSNAGGGSGIVIPGVDNLNLTSPITINVNESIHVADKTPANTGIILNVSEAIHAADTIQQPAAPPVIVTVNEKVALVDGSSAPPAQVHLQVVINETVQVTDTPQP